jgi:hypothetical protein
MLSHIKFLFKFLFFYFLGVCDLLPPRGIDNPKRKRQYEHIKESELKRGASEETAERIAAATVNKTKRIKGETKT